MKGKRMNKELVGMISGGIVVLSAMPYMWRVYESKIHPSITTWSLWSLLGLALLLTYDSSGAEESIWPAVFGFINPLFITALAVWRREEIERLNNTELLCVAITVLSLIMWFFMKESSEMAQYALYVAIIADLIAAIPQVLLVWNSPEKDRPLMWWLFGIGYGLAIFAISKHTIANYALPVYMSIIAFAITMPLIIYRVKEKIPLKEWV